MPQSATIDLQTSTNNWGRRGTAGMTIARQLTFEAISHSFGNKSALINIDLSIPPGEIVCLLGPSGSGKSTLLRIAAGVERVQSGRFLVDNQEYCGPNKHVPSEKRGIGLMFQDFALFPHLTVLQNVAFGLTALSKKSALNEAALSLDRVGLASFANYLPHQLSGGEQQRVALARTIAPRPGILLMDEPFSGLDQRLRDDVRDETIAIIREMNATCLMVTHDPEEAMRIADRIVLLKNGRLVQDGAATNLYNAPCDHSTAKFFSEINSLEGHAQNGIATSAGGEFTADKGLNGPVEILIRHQGVFVSKPMATVQANQLRGRILSKRFLGEVELLCLAAEGIDFPLYSRTRSNGELEVGDEVFIGFDPKDILIFAKS